jgi:hypothetical protein
VISSTSVQAVERRIMSSSLMFDLATGARPVVDGVALSRLVG